MKNKALYAVLVPVTAAAAYVCLWPRGEDAPAAKPAATAAAKTTETPVHTDKPAGPLEPLDIAMAMERKDIVAEFIGNGRDRMKVLLLNKSSAPVLLRVPVGQLFESDHNVVVSVHPGEVEIRPGKTAELAVQTAANRSSNSIRTLYIYLLVCASPGYK